MGSRAQGGGGAAGSYCWCCHMASPMCPYGHKVKGRRARWPVAALAVGKACHVPPHPQSWQSWSLPPPPKKRRRRPQCPAPWAPNPHRSPPGAAGGGGPGQGGVAARAGRVASDAHTKRRGAWKATEGRAGGGGRGDRTPWAPTKWLPWPQAIVRAADRQPTADPHITLLRSRACHVVHAMHARRWWRA